MDQKIVELLKNGEVGVIPTDTVYGLVGSALNPEAVEKIYQLKGRELNKPFIILISSFDDLKKFSIPFSPQTEKLLKSIWPNPVSVILPCPGEKFNYLHRGTNSLAFRMPRKKNLLKLLTQTGPLVAPSANLSNQPEAKTIEEAKDYFKDKVSFYLDEGQLSSPPSTLIKIEDGKIKILREGAYHISQTLYGQTNPT